MIYLLDTNTLIYAVRGLKISLPANERQEARLDAARRIVARCRQQQGAGDQIGVSAITVAELEYGAQRSGDYAKEAAAVRKVLLPFVAFDFDATACALHYGQVRRVLEAAGATIGAMDLLIAGHAKALGATLVTDDLAHFSRVPDLRCETWTA
jgi:tRNA(fMet)-specific endonuclease VapC